MVKSGDFVKVITGDFKGQTGKIKKQKLNYVFVEDITFVKRSKGKEPVTKHRPIHVSNVKKIDSEKASQKA